MSMETIWSGAPGQRKREVRRLNVSELRGGFAFLHFEAEDGHDFLQIFPDLAFGRRVAKQVSGMICGEQFSATKFEPLSAKLGNAAIGLQQSLRGAGAKADDHFGRNNVELAQQEWRALLDFVALWQAIFRWAALHHVADVHISSVQAHRFNHLIQQFSRAADEGQALHVLIVAGAFANENEVGFRITVGENDGVPGAMQLAARAFAKIFAHL